MCHSKHSLLAVGAILVILQLSDGEVQVRSVKNKCLTDLEISTNTSATSLRISWNYSCSDVKEFKIYWKQTRYLACAQDIDEFEQKQNSKSTQDHIIVLEGLLPYSQYSIEVKAIKNTRSRPEREKGAGTTLGALPEVRLKKDSRAKNGNFATENSLIFSWEAPTDCTGYNGELGGYYYELNGDDQSRNDYLSLDQTRVDIDELEPFTNYSLSVYVTDVNRKKSENPLTLSQTTLPGKPPAPTGLDVSINYEGYFIKWTAPNPPKGQLDYYILRWKEESSSDWLPSVKLQHESYCEEAAEAAPVCTYTTDTLDTSSNFTFQITAVNQGVTDTDPTWSKPFRPVRRTLAGESWSSGTIIIVSLVVVVCLLLVVIVIIVVIWKCKRKKSFEGILQYDPDKPSPFDRDDHTRDTTRTTRTHLSDYSDLGGVPKIQENGNKTEPYKVVDIVFPDQDTSRRSFHDPLPLRPGEEEPIYQEPNLMDKDKDCEEVYLAPRVASVESLDDDGYLRPNYKPPREDIDQSDEAYLKPNFNRPPRIDTLDRSPDREFRPVIPITSYDSNDGLEMDNNITKNPRVLQSAV